MTLARLAALARHELAQLNYPPPNWVPPRATPGGAPLLDVLVVGAGMCGQTAAFALLREGVRNLRCVDRCARGREGPWTTFARMETLRSPKHLTGPDLGVASLTYRAWHEARYGEDDWKALHKVDRLAWADYLLWVREVTGVPVESDVEVVSLGPGKEWIEARLATGEVVLARKVVLAVGREGSGALRWPRFATYDPARRGARVFHSADDIDFARLAGRHVAVVGAGASAFDNAAEALEAGARVSMLVRRAWLPQVNKSKWTAFPGFLHGYAALDDARRWRFYTYIFSEQVPPPWESVLRCERHAAFEIRFAQRIADLREGPDAVRVVLEGGGEEAFDAVIAGTGFDVNVAARPELAAFAADIETWRAHVPPGEAERYPEEARFPYLGDAFQLRGRADGLGRIHVFNWGATLSHGALAGDIPGLEIGARRLAAGVARDLFLEDADRHWQRLLAHNEDELKPTRYYVPPEKR